MLWGGKEPPGTGSGSKWLTNGCWPGLIHTLRLAAVFPIWHVLLRLCTSSRQAHAMRCWSPLVTDTGRGLVLKSAQRITLTDDVTGLWVLWPFIRGWQQCVTCIVSSLKSLNLDWLDLLSVHKCFKEVDFCVSTLCNLFVPVHRKSNETGFWNNLSSSVPLASWIESARKCD